MKLIDHLQNVQANSLNVMLSGSDLKLSFVSKIIRLDDSQLILRNTVPLEFISSFIHSKQHFLNTGSYRIKAQKVDSDGVNLIIHYQEGEQTAETRSEERMTMSDQEAWCEFQNPIDRETIIRKRLLDFSKTGFSLVTSWESNIFQPNVEISNMKIQVDESSQNVCGRVIYNRQFVNLEGRTRHQIGFQIIYKD